MTADRLRLLRVIIQIDANARGLATQQESNLLTACPDDFQHACVGLAGTPSPALLIVTGFFIPTATPPCAETDGPLGAVFLCRALLPLGFRIALATDAGCVPALRAGLLACRLHEQVPILQLAPKAATPERYLQDCVNRLSIGPLTHLLALERPGPSHTLASLQAQGQEALGGALLDFLDLVPEEHQDRCHTMRGADITAETCPAHLLFEAARAQGLATIGIGDGGNEIGMGKIPWDVIRRNVPGGGRIACRVPTDRLIVCGVSNWGAYALPAGVALARGQKLPAQLFDAELEQKLLQQMVHHGPLVDGVLGRRSATVDGLTWVRYAAILGEIRQVLEG